MCQTSFTPLKPSVISSPTRAPLSCTRMFVPTVVPWVNDATSSGPEVGVEQLAQAVDDRASGFLGRGRDLQHVDLAGLVLEHDHVGERSARVNCNRLHREPAFLACGVEREL